MEDGQEVKKSGWTVGKLRNFLKKYNQEAEVWVDDKSLADVFHLTENPKETQAVQLSSVDESEVLGQAVVGKRGEKPDIDHVQTEDIPKDQDSEILSQHHLSGSENESSDDVGASDDTETSDDEKTDPSL